MPAAHDRGRNMAARARGRSTIAKCQRPSSSSTGDDPGAVALNVIDDHHRPARGGSYVAPRAGVRPGFDELVDAICAERRAPREGTQTTDRSGRGTSTEAAAPYPAGHGLRARTDRAVSRRVPRAACETPALSTKTEAQARGAPREIAGRFCHVRDGRPATPSRWGRGARRRRLVLPHRRHGHRSGRTSGVASGARSSTGADRAEIRGGARPGRPRYISLLGGCTGAVRCIAPRGSVADGEPRDGVVAAANQAGFCAPRLEKWRFGPRRVLAATGSGRRRVWPCSSAFFSTGVDIGGAGCAPNGGDPARRAARLSVWGHRGSRTVGGSGPVDLRVAFSFVTEID